MLQKNTYSPFRKPELSYLRALPFIFILALILFISTTNVYSAQVTLAWNPNTESDLAGHKLYNGYSSGNYEKVTDVGNQTSYTLSNLVEGQKYYIALTAYDTFNNESGYSAEVVYTVPGGNSVPVLDTIADITVNEGATITISPTATDPDGDALTYTYSGWMTSSSYTTNFNDSGAHIVTVTVSDGTLTDSQAVTVTVLNSNNNSAPVLDTIADITVNEGATITISPTATDPDGDALVYTYSGWMSSASYTANYNDAGTHTVTVTVSDGSLSDSQVVTITVVEKDIVAPVVSNINVASGETYEIVENGLQNGAMVYIDRDYTYSTVPTSLQGATYIKTANNDKNSSAASFLTFDVNQDVTVYVAYDGTVSTKPSWLETFTDTGDDLVNTDKTLNLFARNFSAGTITLGGNEDGNSMYTVIIVGQGNDPVKITADNITTGDIDGNGQDDVIIDYGPGLGVWTFMNDSNTGTQIHPKSPETMTTGDLDGNGQDDIVADFGTGQGLGIWVFMNSSTWIQVYHLSPESVTTGDVDRNGSDDIIVDFGTGPGLGIWVLKDLITWIQVYPNSPESVTTGDIDGNGSDDIIVDFGTGQGLGIWVLQDLITWMQIHPLSPESVTTGDIDGNGQDEIIFDYGTKGIWSFMYSGEWLQIHTLSPESVTTGDVDGNGHDDVIVDFGTGSNLGIQSLINLSTWKSLSLN